ncbi:hypothetical protein LTR39_006885, partial [Cryomyces antarcticus]
MSVPYSIKDQKSELSQNLMVSTADSGPASSKIPMIAQHYVSERARKTLDIVEKFVEEE